MPAQVAPTGGPGGGPLILGKPIINSNGISPTSGLMGGGTGRLPAQGGVLGTLITVTGMDLLTAWKVLLFGNFGGTIVQAPFAAVPLNEQLAVNQDEVHWGVLTRVSNTQLRFTIPPASPNHGMDAVASGKIQIWTSAGVSLLSAQTLTITGTAT